MRSGAAAGHTGYFHETALYGSDEELLAVTLPFLEGGVEAGEPTIVTFGDANASLVRRAAAGTSWLSEVRFLPGADTYSRPAATIRSYCDLFQSLVDDGARQIRVVGDVPHPGTGLGWRPWAQYEAAVNAAYEQFPLWGLCPYDTRTAPDEVLADVLRTHPHVARADGSHAHNDHFDDPVEVLASLPAAPHPVESSRPPDVDLSDPTPADVRRSLARLAPPSLVDDVVTAASEVVTNAMLYGGDPVRARAWALDEGVVVVVDDGGHGVDDPYAGLLPSLRDDGEGGYGLWMAHQLCREVQLERRPGGFRVRLLAGAA